MERLKLDSVRASNEPDTGIKRVTIITLSLILVVFEGLHKTSFR